tara:strand:- start:90 stop:482 length:393 start_codon:yes stop_codon:yes gene_type:complete
MTETGIYYANFKLSISKVTKMAQDCNIMLMNQDNSMFSLHYIKTFKKTMKLVVDNRIIFIHPKLRNIFKKNTVVWLHSIHEKLANECQNTEKCKILANIACLIKYISYDLIKRVETMYRKGTYYEETIEC